MDWIIYWLIYTKSCFKLVMCWTKWCEQRVDINTAYQLSSNEPRSCFDPPCSTVTGLKRFQLKRLPRRAEGKCSRSECGGTTARQRNDNMWEWKGRVQVVLLLALECLFTHCMCSGLVFHSWHAAHLSCSSVYSCSLITCLVVLPSPWPRLPPVVPVLFCSVLIRRSMSR